MRYTYILALVRLMENLQSIEMTVTATCNSGDRDTTVPEQVMKQWVGGSLAFCRQKGDELGLDFARTRLEQFAADSRNPMTFEQLRNHITVLRQAIRSDLEFKRFAFVPTVKAVVWDRTAAEWDAVWKRFPSTSDDARDAADAHALGLDTACVYHSMMVLEKGLTALAKKLGVKTARQEWGRILDDIEGAIAAARLAAKSPPKGTKQISPRAARNRADFHSFCSEVAKEFSYFKDAWRNHTAHGRRRYDDREALRVMTHVRDFMTRISERLKEAR